MSSGDNITKRGSSRRKFLAITSTAAAAGIAGCTGGSGGSGSGGASSGGAKSGSTTSKNVIKAVVDRPQRDVQIEPPQQVLQ